MNFRNVRRRSSYSDINLTPLLDLFLNILIFFLVTTTFAKDTVFLVDLPKSQSSGSLAQENQVIVGISADNRFAINNREVTEENMRNELNLVPAEKRSSIPFIVRADQKSLHGKVVFVLDLANDLGFRAVGVASESTEGKGP